MFKVKELILESEESEEREKRKTGGVRRNTESGMEGEGLCLCPGLHFGNSSQMRRLANRLSTQVGLID